MDAASLLCPEDTASFVAPLSLAHTIPRSLPQQPLSLGRGGSYVDALFRVEHSTLSLCTLESCRTLC